MTRQHSERSRSNSNRLATGNGNTSPAWGSVLTYLNSFDYALLVMPLEAIDGFEIASYLGETVRSKPLDTLPIGILGYTIGPGRRHEDG